MHTITRTGKEVGKAKGWSSVLGRMRLMKMRSLVLGSHDVIHSPEWCVCVRVWVCPDERVKERKIERVAKFVCRVHQEGGIFCNDDVIYPPLFTVNATNVYTQSFFVSTNCLRTSSNCPQPLNLSLPRFLTMACQGCSPLWWVLCHSTVFARLVWGRLEVNQASFI